MVSEQVCWFKSRDLASSGAWLRFKPARGELGLGSHGDTNSRTNPFVRGDSPALTIPVVTLQCPFSCSIYMLNIDTDIVQPQAKQNPKNSCHDPAGFVQGTQVKKTGKIPPELGGERTKPHGSFCRIYVGRTLQ